MSLRNMRKGIRACRAVFARDRPERRACEYHINERHIHTEHQHVQLALHYADKKDPYHRTDLKALLKPYHASYYPYCENDSKPHDAEPKRSYPYTTELKYSAFPRIAKDASRSAYRGGGHELRFLLKSEWRYGLRSPLRADRKSMWWWMRNRSRLTLHAKPTLPHGVSVPSTLRSAIGSVEICPHIRVCRPGCPNHIHSEPGGRDSALEDAVNAALAKVYSEPETERSRTEVHGTCKRCPTGFSVYVQRRRPVWQRLRLTRPLSSCVATAANSRLELEIHAWQDFGSAATSSADPAWSAHIKSLSGNHPNYDNYGPRVYHTPRSVEELYDLKRAESVERFLRGCRRRHRMKRALGARAHRSGDALTWFIETLRDRDTGFGNLLLPLTWITSRMMRCLGRIA